MAELGYIRVSTVDQNLDRQLDGLTLDKVFEDKLSGKNTSRDGLHALIDYAREGDTVHVHSIDRLARSIVDLKTLVGEWNAKGISVRFHKENMHFASGGANSAMTELMFNMLASFAEFERSIMLERQREGIAKAKEKGVYKGRKADTERNEQILALLDSGMSVRKIALEVGCNPSTVQRVKKQRTDG